MRLKYRIGDLSPEAAERRRLADEAWNRQCKEQERAIKARKRAEKKAK